MKPSHFNFFMLFPFLLVFMACQTEPEPIRYGSDACSFCKMTIIDKKFGTELVTKKGKVFKFDDTGCMVKYMKTSATQESDFQHIVFNSLENPGEFITLNKSFFVRSETLKSPMLGNVAVFKSEAVAKNFISKVSKSEHLEWSDIKKILSE